MNNHTNWTIALGGLLLIGTCGAQAAEPISVSTSANYSTGSYGTGTTTDIWSAPLSAAYKTERWVFTVSVPYIRISGAGNVIPGTGPVDNSNPLVRGLDDVLGGGATPNGSTRTVATSASGFGDVVATAGYTLTSSADRNFALALTGKVKFGTANANKGLGTGENDYGLSLDTYKVLGNWTPFGGVGWMHYASSPYIRLKNGFSANTGVDYQLQDNDNVGVYYNYRQRIAVGGARQGEVTAYWNHRIDNSLRLQTYALGGTTQGSPDWGVGAALHYSF